MTGFRTCHLVHGNLAVLRRLHLEAQLAQDHHGDLPVNGVILNQQDAHFGKVRIASRETALLCCCFLFRQVFR